MSYYSEVDEAKSYFNVNDKLQLVRDIKKASNNVAETQVVYYWTQRDGSKIKVSDMGTSHIKNSLAMVKRGTKDNECIRVLTNELSKREKVNERKASQSSPVIVKGAKVTMLCHCGQQYKARSADLARGWGLSCSKRCAAIRRDFGRPAAKVVNHE